jgi:hypothetical protein
VAAGAWWWLGLGALQGWQLLAGLVGTAFSRRHSGRTRTWQSGRAWSAPTACCGAYGGTRPTRPTSPPWCYYPLPLLRWPVAVGRRSRPGGLAQPHDDDDDDAFRIRAGRSRYFSGGAVSNGAAPEREQENLSSARACGAARVGWWCGNHESFPCDNAPQVRGNPYPARGAMQTARVGRDGLADAVVKPRARYKRLQASRARHPIRASHTPR